MVKKLNKILRKYYTLENTSFIYELNFLNKTKKK